MLPDCLNKAVRVLLESVTLFNTEFDAGGLEPCSTF